MEVVGIFFKYLINNCIKVNLKKVIWDLFLERFFLKADIRTL